MSYTGFLSQHCWHWSLSWVEGKFQCIKYAITVVDYILKYYRSWNLSFVCVLSSRGWQKTPKSHKYSQVTLWTIDTPHGPLYLCVIMRRGESSKKVKPKKTVKDIATGKPPSRGSKASESHLLGDKMRVFSNPHLKGASPIPPKPIGQLAEKPGESEPIIWVMRSQANVDVQTNQLGGESVWQGSVQPCHDQEIPSKPSLSFVGTQC